MQRDTAGSHWRSAALVTAVSLAAVGLAGCGGSKAPSVAAVATTASSTVKASGRAAATGANGGSTSASSDPSRLLVEWAACMRSHGDPDQADPSIDAHGVIHITWNPAIPGGYDGTNKGGHGNSGPGQYCRTYLADAQNELRKGRPQNPPSNAQMVKFSECMRAHGIHDFPDPTANGLQLNRGGDLNPDNPAFQNASRICARKTGVRGFGVGPLPPGTIKLANP